MKLETWEEIRARHVREKIELAQSLTEYTVKEAAEILQMSQDTLRPFANYYGINFKKVNRTRNEKSTNASRSAHAEILEGSGGLVAGRTASKKPASERKTQSGTGKIGTETVHGEAKAERASNLTQYEDAYREAWAALTKKDAKVNQMIRPPSSWSSSQARKQEYGRLGGRPQHKSREMIEKAYKMGIKVDQIAAMCQCDKSTVRRVIRELR